MINNLYAQSTLPATTTANSTTAALVPGGGQNQLLGLLIWVLVFGAIMYFFMIMPQKRREKKAKEMVSSLAVNDIITTIGGLTGKIVAIKDDEVTIETGIEKSKVTFKNWAIKDAEKND